MHIPRVMVAAPHGRSGKTTVCVGLVAALAARGIAVQPFKKGPDYIDPSWLTGAGGRPCRNLDLFMMGEEATAEAFRRGTAGTDIAVVEAAMGLYDGLDLDGTGSSAALARLLGTPILLVVDASRMTRSVAALVSGYQHFEPGVNIAGVILNNVARARHEEMLTGSIERHCGIPVVGAIPRRQDLKIPDRHLGLVPRAESEDPSVSISSARRAVEQHVDLDLVLSIARSAPGVGTDPVPSDIASQPLGPVVRSAVAKIGVMRDRVFTFYYPENLEALEAAGAELVTIDSLADPSLPDVDALYIGGGFPELFMEQIEANGSLRREIRERARNGMPVYAECAGLIYLSNRLRWGDRSAEMAGVLPCDIEMTAKPQGHGYVAGEVVTENPFIPVGAPIRGHEFHNTRVANLEPGYAGFAFSLSKGSGIDGGHVDGLLIDRVLASYTHLHAFAVPGWADRFVDAARRESGREVAGRGRRR